MQVGVMTGKQTEIGTALNGWKYVVEERVLTCELTGVTESEFWVWKIGVYEYVHKPRQFLGVFRDFDSAKKAAERSRHRSLVACGW